MCHDSDSDADNKKKIKKANENVTNVVMIAIIELDSLYQGQQIRRIRHQAAGPTRSCAEKQGRIDEYLYTLP